MQQQRNPMAAQTQQNHAAHASSRLATVFRAKGAANTYTSWLVSNIADTPPHNRHPHATNTATYHTSHVTAVHQPNMRQNPDSILTYPPTHLLDDAVDMCGHPLEHLAGFIPHPHAQLLGPSSSGMAAITTTTTTTTTTTATTATTATAEPSQQKPLPLSWGTIGGR